MKDEDVDEQAEWITICIGLIFASLCCVIVFPLLFGGISIFFFAEPNNRQRRIDNFNAKSRDWEINQKALMDVVSPEIFASSEHKNFSRGCTGGVDFKSKGHQSDDPKIHNYAPACLSFSVNLDVPKYDENASPYAVTIENESSGEVVEISVPIFELEKKTFTNGKYAEFDCLDAGGEYQFWNVKDNCYIYKQLKRVCVTLDPEERRFRSVSNYLQTSEEESESGASTTTGCFNDDGYGLYQTGSESDTFSIYELTIEIRSLHDPEIYFWRDVGENYFNPEEEGISFGDPIVATRVSGYVTIAIGLIPPAGLITIELFVVLVVVLWHKNKKRNKDDEVTGGDEDVASDELMDEDKRKENEAYDRVFIGEE